MAENNKNLTIFQRLSQTFGPNGLLQQDIPTYKFDKIISILKLFITNQPDWRHFMITNQWSLHQRFQQL